jgi:arylsulfatase A-like enzyme
MNQRAERINTMAMKNVILLTLDATRKDVFGIYGNKKGLTPTFDSLETESLIFTKAQNVGPYTQASFPGLLTSSYFLDYGQPKGLSPERTLISEPLQKAGIVTAAFHSNPYICAFLGWNRGWDVFYDSMDDEVEARIPYIRGNVVNQKAIDWVSAYQKEGGKKPFFLWLHYMDVHEPYMPEIKYVDMVAPSLTMTPDEMYSLFETVLLKRDLSDPTKIDFLRKLYEIHVREIDTYFEELLNCLKKIGILEHTIIIIANDHGDEFNEHGGLSHNDKMYSELIDMPLIIYGSGEKGFRDTVVSSVDIPPTVINLFDLEPMEKFQGHSLIPLKDYPEKGVYGEAIDQKSKRGGDIEKDVYFYREGDLKIIYRANLDSWEMYDLKTDPKEFTNIVDTSLRAEELKSKLKPRVRRWVK